MVTFIASAILLAQLYLEGWRWQLTPLYLAVFAALTVDLTRLPTKLSDLPGGKSIRRALLGIAGLIILGLIPLLFPVPKLPKPTGANLVGTLSFEVTDKSRSELYSEEQTDRRLAVSIWYPAGSKTKRAPWINDSDEMLPAIARSGHLPSWMLGHLQYIKTHSYLNAPLLETGAKLPVVFFEHGLWGYRGQSTFLAEDLASHGVVVVATEHPYGAIKTVFLDGSSVAFSRDVLPASSDPDYDAAAKRLAQQWADDLSFMLDYLSSNPALTVGGLAENLELSQIALIGHSTGGASSLDFCAQDDRCAAALLLDPWLQPVAETILENGISQPVISLFSDPKLHYFSEANAERYATFSANDSAPLKTLTLLDSGHHNFDDSALLSPIARFVGHSVGKISAYRGFEIIREYANALVQSYLLNESKTLLEASSPPFPEIQVEASTLMPAADQTEETLKPETVSPEPNPDTETPLSDSPASPSPETDLPASSGN